MSDEGAGAPRPMREGIQDARRRAQEEEEQSQDPLQLNLDSSVIAVPLLKRIQTIRAKQEQRRRRVQAVRNDPEAARDADIFDVIIDVNLNYAGTDQLSSGPPSAPPPPDSSRERAKQRVRQLIASVLADRQGYRGKRSLGVYERKSRLSHQYLFACLDAAAIEDLVAADNQPQPIVRADGTTAPSDSPAPGARFAEPLQTGTGIRGRPPVSPETHPTREAPAHRAIYRIWEDFKIKALLTESVATVKANAAHVAFGALGRGIVWAVMDSGIKEDHRHFLAYDNLDLPAPLRHTDFTGISDPPNATADPGAALAHTSPTSTEVNAQQALTDEFGHGTHVAGIIAGGLPIPEKRKAALIAQEKELIAQGSTAVKPRTDWDIVIVAVSRQRDETGRIDYQGVAVDAIGGIAPECKLLSLKVLDKDGQGSASSVIAAINYVQEINGYGRRLQIHGVNLSVGYEFKPEWFACGQSPLCVEVDRLVRSGVSVVVAAGNTGYGTVDSQDRGKVGAGLALTVNDPGNAELAITVGSTHRNMPHIYGVSYFSSKGPTGDGRLKPDLVAPGERILSCAAGRNLRWAQAGLAAGGAAGSPAQPAAPAAPGCDYVEQSGTSMAAPHVSGAIAAFLSVRREYVGRPEEVKRIVLATATDLGRQRDFQGHGLIDLMRAIQSV